jgi:hypothetical protein
LTGEATSSAQEPTGFDAADVVVGVAEPEPALGGALMRLNKEPEGGFVLESASDILEFPAQTYKVICEPEQFVECNSWIKIHGEDLQSSESCVAQKNL